jgi:hypothetical protein
MFLLKFFAWVQFLLFMSDDESRSPHAKILQDTRSDFRTAFAKAHNYQALDVRTIVFESRAIEAGLRELEAAEH